MAQAGVEPAASFVLSEGGLPIAYRAASDVPHLCPGQGPIRPTRPNRCPTCNRSGLSRTAQPLAYLGCFLQMIPDGLEPSLPGCRPGVFAAGPRDRVVLKSGPTGNRTRISGLQDRRLPVGP